MERILTYGEALEWALNRAPLLPSRRVPLAQALGLAVAEEIHAADPLPPFTNSAMDGFAFRAAEAWDAEQGCGVRLPLSGSLPAGGVPEAPLAPGTAMALMTGAPLPEGADTVVPQERVRSGPGWVELSAPPLRGAHVRRVGEDIPAGGLLVTAGTILRPAGIGILAAAGCLQVPVRPRARVAVVTTGDELVDAARRPGPGQIRDANLHALCAQVSAAGADPLPIPRIPDRKAAVAEALERALGEADLVLVNGGVSGGAFDFSKEVLEEAGAREVFWRVAQKPGGPLGLWTFQDRPVFGLPGNPVAAMVTFEEYVRPVLRRMMGLRCLHRPWRTGVLQTPWRRNAADGKLHFLQVTCTGREVFLAGPQGSARLSTLAQANALALIPEDVQEVPAGGTVLLHLVQEREDH